MSELTVIAGCGYLGTVLARELLRLGRPVLGLTRQHSSALALTASGIPALACDLTDSASLTAMARETTGATSLRVVHCAASGRGSGVEEYRATYLEAARNLREAFTGARFFFTSSTSVYPQISGEVVTEDTPAQPDRETGRILRQTEEETLAAGGIAGRLAGIYGPGRSVLLRHFLEGKSVIDVRTEPPATPDGRWINQIHVQDAARAISLLLDLPAEQGQLFNIADSFPTLQRTIYSRLAARFQRSLPPEAAPDHTRKRGWTHKQVSNARLCGLGWQPMYPDWFHALEHDPDFLPSLL